MSVRTIPRRPDPIRPRRVVARTTNLISRAARGLVIIGLAGCVRRTPPAAQSHAVPTLEAITPNPFLLREGSNATLTIRGQGFSADSNTVRIGSQQWDGIPSLEAGTRIQFIVPDRVPSGGGAAPQFWVSGEYAVSVRTRHGASAAVSLSMQAVP